jgi:CheY-like chemotaxis protein
LRDGRTGLDVIERIRRVFGTPIPAFLNSGDTAPERLREARARGYYLLYKPVLPITLRSVVSQSLRDHEETIVSHEPTVQQFAANPNPTLPLR